MKKVLNKKLKKWKIDSIKEYVILVNKQVIVLINVQMQQILELIKIKHSILILIGKEIIDQDQNHNLKIDIIEIVIMILQEE